MNRAIEEPMRWIAQNAGEEGSIVVNKVKELEGDQGYNAAKGKYENLVKLGRDRSDQGRSLRAP